MTAPRRKIVYLTAGAAGMFCGSCMHDNTLARALIGLGHDVQLLPLYTPIRTDEQNVSSSQMFFGGVRVYLQEQHPWLRFVPRPLLALLDQPWLIRALAGRGAPIDAHVLGGLTISMLRGTHGHQRREALRLVDWLEAERPDLLDFTNVLIAGCLPEVKARLNVPVVVTLQGDDIFLQDLREPFQSQALAEIRRLAEFVDVFLVYSRYYADFMSGYLGLPREKFRIVPLGLDTRDFAPLLAEGRLAPPPGDRPPTVGYLARLAPEKGLHLLAEAFQRLRRLPGMSEARLRIAGWRGAAQRKYADEVFASLRQAGLGDAFEYVGEVDRPGKLAFLRSVDVLSVPTTYREPKGLYVLEALAAGVPVVQPGHGAFPEMLGDLAGGLDCRPGDATHLAERLHELLRDPPRRQALAEQGAAAVHGRRNASAMAETTLGIFDELWRRRADQEAGRRPPSEKTGAAAENGAPETDVTSAVERV